MPIRVTAAFDVTGWESAPYEADVPGPRLDRVLVRKRFRGELEGESNGQLLMCQAVPGRLEAGAGYIVAERFIGRLGGRSGSFVMHHWGVSGDGRPPRTGGHVVPGSGTGELAGLTGTLEIAVGKEGHRLVLDYELGERSIP